MREIGTQVENDFSLLRKCLEKDEDAFRILLDKYKGKVFSILYRFTGSREDAEDLAQEVFIKAFRSLESFNFENRFSSWLFKIASNHAIDYLRARKKETISLDAPQQGRDGEMLLDLPDRKMSPEQAVIVRDELERIEAALDMLPPLQRVTIILRHKEELSYEEISKIVDKPLGTVKSQIFRGREMLKNILESKKIQVSENILTDRGVE